jgi:hypothetical protein
VAHTGGRKARRSLFAGAAGLVLGLAPLLEPAASSASAGPITVTVSATTILRAVPDRYLGFSIEAASLCDMMRLAHTNRGFVQLFRDLGPGLFRVGAITGDVSASWSTSSAPMCSWKRTVLTPGLVTDFFRFARSVGYQVMWQVPLGNGKLSEDAAEAAYAASLPGIYSIEIGNEPNFYPNVVTQYQLYINEWQQVYTRYMSLGGRVGVSGPSTTLRLHVQYFDHFVQEKAGKLLALTQHYYQADTSLDPHLTCLTLLQLQGTPANLAKMASLATSYNLPLILNETNNYLHYGTPNVSNAYCSALWAAYYLLTGLHDGILGIDLHGVPNFPPGNTSGKLEYFAPIDQSGRPAPEYYGLLFYHAVTHAGGSEVAVSTTRATSLDAFAVAGSDGKLRVALLNRAAAPVPVTLQTDSAYARAGEISLTAPSLSSLSGVTLGGASVAPDGTWAPRPRPVALHGHRATVLVPPYEAIVVTLSH